MGHRKTSRSVQELKRDLFSSFQYLNISQFCSSLNDNLYKYLLLYYLLDLQGLSKSALILSMLGGVFIIPFLVFSIPAGTIADRYSKRNILANMKVVELVTVLLLLFTFFVKSNTLGYIGLFILGTEEAFMSPSKYGIVPELVPKERISYSNGVLTSTSYFGIMLGTFLASAVTEILHHNFILASFLLIIVAGIGLFAAMKIPTTPPAGSVKPFSLLPWEEVAPTLNEARQTKYLLPTIWGSALFLFLASFSQGNVIPYAIYEQGLTDVEGGYLILITTIGVCLGAFITGKLSGPRVELGIVPLACYGFVICFFFISNSRNMLFTTIFEIFIIGMFGGMFLVPLDSYIQYYTRVEERGRYIATTNFLSWCAVLLASSLFYLFRAVFKLTPSQGFEIMGVIAFVSATFYLFCFAFPVVRLLAYILSCIKLFSVHGSALIPKQGAAQIIVSDWKAAFCLIAYRKRIIQVCAEYSALSPTQRRLFSLLGVMPFSEKQKLLDQGRVVCSIQSELSSSPLEIPQLRGERSHTVLTLYKL